MTIRWRQLTEPVSGIIFDCDGTLSAIEGIDELAEKNHVGPFVKQLTAEAMDHKGINIEIYQKRLMAVQPTQLQVETLGEEYFKHRIPYALEVIHILNQLKKTVYIISSGLNPAVQKFADHLGIPSSNIFAVEIKFDQHGKYCDFDQSSPLVQPDGKQIIVSEIRKKQSRIIYIGDGMNDVSVSKLLTRFIGFGGIVHREKVACVSDYYIQTNSLAPLLPLCLTKQESDLLNPNDRLIYEHGNKLLY